MSKCYTIGQLVGAAQQAGFTGAQAAMMGAIAYAEEGDCATNASGANFDNGGGTFGPLQFVASYHAGALERAAEELGLSGLSPQQAANNLEVAMLAARNEIAADPSAICQWETAYCQNGQPTGQGPNGYALFVQSAQGAIGEGAPVPDSSCPGGRWPSWVPGVGGTCAPNITIGSGPSLPSLPSLPKNPLDPGSWISAIESAFVSPFERLGIFVIGTVLALGGLLILGFSSGSVRQAAETGAKAAAA